MNSSWVSIIISLAAILLSAALTWIVTVVLTRQRVTEAEQKLNGMKADIVTLFNHVNAIQSENARCDQSRKTMDIAILRLDEVKASKEMLDSLRSDIHNMDASFSKRFDKVEDMLNRIMGGRLNGS